MARLRAPAVAHDVLADRAQRGVLFASTLALLAVGLLPRILSPSLPNAQEQLRLESEIQNLSLLLSFAATAMVIAGGLVSDIFRRRSLLIGSLAVMLAGSLVSLSFDEGPVFYVANFAAVAASGVVLAYGIGAVAIAYTGVPRATALGIVYAAYGAGAAVSPILLTLFPVRVPSVDATTPASFTFDTSLAYLATTIAATVALLAAVRWMPGIPGSLPASRQLVASVAVWSIGVLAIVTGALGLAGPGGRAVPIVLIVCGAAALMVSTWSFRRGDRGVGGLVLDRRALGAALAVGVAVGFAQAIPLLSLPVVFEYPLRYGTFFAILALAPFAIALFLSGPVSGLLIRRFGPRGMMTGGTLALGAANLLLAVVLIWISGEIRAAFEADPAGGGQALDRAHYLLFVVPLVLIGAGFILSTTVRTAIVFASTPRGLPASAAAINEASVGLGARVGIVAATSAVTITALASLRKLVVERPVSQAETLVAEFEVGLVSLGTPRFEEVLRTVLDGAEPLKRSIYAVAYIDGVVVALLMSGAVGIAGAVVAWLLTGRRDPLETVYDMEDERQGR